MRKTAVVSFALACAKDFLTALIYAAASLFLGFCAVAAGVWLARRF